MALYIKGEKLPKYGYNELRVWPNGTLEFRDKTDVLVRIPNAVIEVKEPHGDLIDRDKLTWLKYVTGEDGTIIGEYVSIPPAWIDRAPALIEAEYERNTSDD